MSQTILFVCATGIATSTAVTEKVMEYCKEHGLKVDYSQTNVASLPNNTSGATLIVSTTKVPYELDIPVVNGLPIITGVGEEKVLEQIVAILTAIPVIVADLWIATKIAPFITEMAKDVNFKFAEGSSGQVSSFLVGGNPFRFWLLEIFNGNLIAMGLIPVVALALYAVFRLTK